jgi:protein phosphatase 2C-like protein
MGALPPPSVFRLPKDGSSRAEYEDAIAWNRSHRRFAVADGASASAFARLWAQLLVRAYVRGQLSAQNLEDDLAPLQARWSEDVEQRDLPWYAAEQARRGAFAALAGLTLDHDGRWTALAIGDCCVFQMRGAALVSATPLTEPEAFNNRPLLVGSRAMCNRQLRCAGAIVESGGEWQPGDTFLLMSDALAAMFLRAGAAFEALNFERTAAGFHQWVCELRAQRELRNDDVSLLWLALPTDAPA